jgi:hypothetical protein
MFLILIALLAFWTVPAAAQVLYGSIVGTVQDPTGSLIPRAKITLIGKATGVTREVETDDAGRFSLLNVLPGEYDLRATAAGFRTSVRTSIDVTINTVTREDLRMEVGQITEQVTVTAAAVLLQTDKSDVHTEISGQVVQNLPLPAYRNYQSLIALVPGASPPAFQNAVVDTPGRALRSFVNGTATNNNNTLTDGAVNINIWLPHHVAYVQPVESIETVNVTTGSSDADQGMAGGAAITLATKSGTNDLHGTGWWFHTNQHLQSAGQYFRSSTYVKPLNILNIGGGNIGGPSRRTSCSISLTSSAPPSVPATPGTTASRRPIFAPATSASGPNTPSSMTRRRPPPLTPSPGRRSRKTKCQPGVSTPFSQIFTKICRCRTNSRRPIL